MDESKSVDERSVVGKNLVNDQEEELVEDVRFEMYVVLVVLYQD